MPRFAERWPPGPAPPVRKLGLLAAAGRPDPEPPPPPAGPLVAIAVGKTKEGESFPAKPGLGEKKSSQHNGPASRGFGLALVMVPRMDHGRRYLGTYLASRSRYR